MNTTGIWLQFFKCFQIGAPHKYRIVVPADPLFNFIGSLLYINFFTNFHLCWGVGLCLNDKIP